MKSHIRPRGLSFFSWPLLMLLASVGLAWANPSSVLLDPDTLWHLRSGEWIAKHKTIPTVDFYSHTFFGKPWHAHEWLSSLILFGVFQAFSWPGLVALSALAAGTTTAVLTRFLIDRLAPPRALLIATLTLVSLHSHLLARPHILAVPLLAIWITECVKAREKERAPPIWLAMIMVLWANLHGSFILGLVLIGFFAIEALASNNKESRWHDVRAWVFFGLVALSASIATPHHIHGLLFPFELQKMTYALSVINEWQPANFQRFQLQEVWVFSLFFLAWLIKPKTPWTRLLLLALLMHQSLAHNRHLTLIAIIAPVILASPLQQALSALDQPTNNKFDRFFNRTNRAAHPVSVAIAVLLVFFVPVLLTSSHLRPPELTMPTQAIQALKKASDDGRTLNSYRFGGALIYSGVPVFVDGRADIYGDEFLKETLEAINGKPGALQSLLDKYGVNQTFLDSSAAAVTLLDLSPTWERIYADDMVVIHQKTIR